LSPPADGRFGRKLLTRKPGAAFAASATFRLAFPRYRVLLYNSTAKAADAAVYAYLSTS